MTKKTPRKKARLAKKTRQNRRIPAFVMIRTKRKVQSNNRTRNWRTDKMKNSEKE